MTTLQRMRLQQIADRTQVAVDRDFVTLVGHLSNEKPMRDMAAYGSAALSDNDERV